MIALYLHIPFCSQICHYCDFAKTARFDEDQVQGYFRILTEQIALGLSYFPQQTLSSVYFGGGTPGLFTKEYEGIFRTLSPYINHKTEITLEANPHNATKENLNFWSDLGVNRLSLGIQTFSLEGLSFLKRDHNPDVALKALEEAARVFPNLNGDLIYGWPGQTGESWAQDLKTLTSFPLAHVSLYDLTYAPGTPIGRAYGRGQLKTLPPQEANDQRILSFYLEAKDFLEDQGFRHGEVSNYYKLGYPPAHNFLYWTQEGHYLGLGAGASGYLPGPNPWGVRYQVPASLKHFGESHWQEGLVKLFKHNESSPSFHVDPDRDQDSWVTESVGSALRCERGVDLERILRGQTVPWTPSCQEGFRQGLLSIKGHRLFLDSKEWIREHRWALEVVRSLT
jgi:oxygen-independent coproporphyrinogen-3 oxidase